MARITIRLAQLSLTVAVLMLLDTGVASCQGEWVCIANVGIDQKTALCRKRSRGGLKEMRIECRN